MLSISGTTIRLTRGDTAYLSVEITNSDGSVYDMDPGDELALSVKKYYQDQTYVFQKIAHGIPEFKILPEDTSGLDFGTYKYDVQLNRANGDIYTVIPMSDLELQKEVTV